MHMCERIDAVRDCSCGEAIKELTIRESGSTDCVLMEPTSTSSPESTGTEKNAGAGFVTRYPLKLSERHRCHGRKSMRPPPRSTMRWSAAVHSAGNRIGLKRPQFH